MAQPAAQSTQQMSPAQIAMQQNMLARTMILKQAVKRKQQIDSQTFDPANGNIYTCNKILAVGLLLRFYVEVECTYSALTEADSTITATDFAQMNSLSNVQFTDLQNNQRHNTTGLQLAMTQSFKDKMPFVGAKTYAQVEGNFGANWALTYATPPALGVVGKSRVVYEIPIAYSDDDLRGAIYANVVSNQMNLQLTVNNVNAAPSTGDDTFAIFYLDPAAGEAGAVMTSVTINIYQEYLDQLPIGLQGIVLPQLDISTLYQLMYTNFSNFTAGQDNYVQYTNFRRFMSLTGIWNSTGTRGGRLVGSDINFWKLVSASLTSIWQEKPLERARVQRRILGTDPPPGTYYFPSRKQPIYTLATGNMQLDLVPIVAGPNAYLYIMWEFFAQQNTLTQAGSLAAGS
jgi:hypothetical protein